MALDGFRRHATRLAGAIADDLPGFTGHDVEHLDALWATADVIVGDGWTLNPAEAFVFGGAVLLHDLALSTAAYLDGSASVEQGDDFADALRLALRSQLRREPTEDELADPAPQARNDAREAVLRARHARRASELATSPLSGPEGELYLLEDSELRDDLGWLIGQIAASHGWDLIEVNATFAGLAPTPKDLAGWPVDALAIACLLRCADAAQLDGRRARALQQAVQRPVGDSADHWNFQRRLHPARRDGDRLIFESTRPFEPGLTDAWWLAYEWLSMADGELRAVDALLADRRPERRFAARSVAGTDAPARLAERVKTEGWLPVDARLHVSNVTELARRLGGRQLYGDAGYVPLRELVQNASDAVRARRALDAEESAGAVTVALHKGHDGALLEVRDDGVGMSEEVLTGPLLDFGTSLWNSSGVAWHLPGLAAAGFRSVGRFGIGFFAAFMWSEQVTVISRPRHSAVDQTRVLDFAGLSRRPLLRPASGAEQLRAAGTVVRLRLAREDMTALDPRRARSSREPRDEPPRSLSLAMGWLAPASEVDLLAEGQSKPRRVVRGGDWKTLKPERLMARVAGVASKQLEPEERKLVAKLMRPLEQDGDVVGRAALLPGRPSWEQAAAALVVGGLRVAPYEDMAGLLLGEDPNVARTQARPLATRATLIAWADEQARLLGEVELPLRDALTVAETLAACGANTGKLPICVSHEGPLDAAGVIRWAAERSDRVVYLFDPAQAEDISSLDREGFSPSDDVLEVDSYSVAPSWWENARGEERGQTLQTLCRTKVCEGWGGIEEIDPAYAEHMGTGQLGDVQSGFYESVRKPGDQEERG